MNIPMLLRKGSAVISKNSPAILTGLSVAGLIGTVLLSIRATTNAVLIRDEIEEEYALGETIPKSVYFKRIAPVYIPTIVMAGVTIACMVSATAIGTKRNALLSALYAASEVSLKEYQDKVVAVVGEKDERKIRDEIARDRIENNPIQNNEVFITGRGDSLCYDALSGRYFMSDIEKIRRVQNDINADIIGGMQMWKSLNEVYSEMGLPPNELGDDVGWNVDRKLEFDFSSQLTGDGRPCLVIGYVDGPRADYRTGF